MPTRRPENPYKPGDVVTMANNGNGTGEGVLWRVRKVDKVWIWIEPVWTATGPSVLRPKRVQYFSVDAADLVQLGSLYAQLGNIIRDIAVSRGMVGERG